MAIQAKEFKPLFVNGKRDSARRYVNAEGEIISRRQYEKSAGILQQRPSSKPGYIPQQKWWIEQYQRDLLAYAHQHKISLRQARSDPQFRRLYRRHSRKWKRYLELQSQVKEYRKNKQTPPKELTDKIEKLQDELNDLMREIGRKQKNDYTEFGQTPK